MLWLQRIFIWQPGKRVLSGWSEKYQKEKETVTIDNAGNISSGNEDTEEEEEEFISIKDEVRFENKIKIVDHIDLNPEKNTTGTGRSKGWTTEKRNSGRNNRKVEEPKVTWLK